MHITYLTFAERLSVEILQSADEGKNIEKYMNAVKEIKTLDDNKKEEKSAQLMDELISINAVNAQIDEPSDIEDIRKRRSSGPRRTLVNMDDDILYDKIFGAWLGRCSGCLLGQPVEGWYRDRIWGFAKDTNNYPINYYFSSKVPDDIRKKYNIKDDGIVYSSNKINWINNIGHMVEDDDTNYTILALSIINQYGLNFTSENVAESWMFNLPILHTCSAERVAYQNISNMMDAPQSAIFRNPYREWIGAQIRADFYGYITPGYPELGAEMAWRDARISHTKNGIYGAMWVAAMLSAAAITDDIEEVIRVGLSEIPKDSRLAKGINKVFEWQKEGLKWEEAIDRLHEEYDETIGHNWCHTIPNAMIVAISLIYGHGDFERSVGIAILAAFDTDCNAATVGSIIGMLQGAGNLPYKWIEPLKDTIISGVQGFGKIAISELARRTIPFARRTMQL
ncbi:MAG: ADP-ribosylglycohydrolase family protein [Xylanivirga thermophila]|jgi:ADP-ribosylglycohydrolase|uniref:ADP-ribosylglycohydrolase family protein n=1 Tax=Xylanivirga thermophila TaxID=2496273 RepID=UPI0039F53102